jgi:hypothetical protein
MFGNRVRRVAKRAHRWLGALLESAQRDWMIKLDELCTDLRALGVKARITEGDPTGKGALHVISIAQSPIRWVKLTGVGLSDNFEWVVESWIHDPRSLPRMEIESFGMRWEGDYQETGIAQHLSNDRAIGNAILETGDSVKVRTSPKNGYWIILDSLTPNWWHRPVIKQEQWDCYERIAAHLLETPIPVQRQ